MDGIKILHGGLHVGIAIYRVGIYATLDERPPLFRNSLISYGTSLRRKLFINDAGYGASGFHRVHPANILPVF
jgi:hypothetical protein